jgi:cation-dependent mannose-6-phosphate receptor
VDGKTPGKNEKTDDWHARGYDYANFTLNICAPVVDPVDHVEGFHNYQEKNVSAYYKVESKTFSIGYELFPRS